MSSILTNNGAMVALQTLKSINKNLSATQNEISTGKSVATAKDNAAVWSISKVMESDVKGFQGIQDSLSLGDSTVSVARQASETVTDLLTQIKGKIVAAQEENVDRSKIQADISALRDQIGAVVGAAQFNGLNLLANDGTTDGSGTVKVLASLDRSTSGVTASDISISKQDLRTTQQDFTGGTVNVSTADQNLNATQTQTLTVAAPTAGQVYSLELTGTDADSSLFVPATYTTGATIADAKKIFYVAKDGDSAANVAAGLASAFAKYATDNNLDSNILDITASNNTLVATSGVTTATDFIAVGINVIGSPTSVTVGGGLAALNDIDVSTNAGADAALTAIEDMIGTAIDASAAFGSAQGRLETQQEFVSGMVDALKAGIGTMVDADMEEASARLQALQVQQQLGVQALSIANQAPQTILSLFR
jgi:flagellin